MNGGEPLAIPCGELSLEGRLHVAPAGASAAGAVICHPHPLHGGTMDHPVVVALARALAAAGFAALRFNFRGVGSSGGSHGGGAPEARDVRAALDHVDRATGGDAPLVLAGYSFGAWVAYPLACEAPRVGAVLCVAPPLELLPMPPVPPAPVARWFAVGDADPYCPPAVFRSWYRDQGGPKEHLLLTGADHFLTGREDELAAAAARFAAGHRTRRTP